jgi:polyhydroxyalkanoate synthesis regulator phasin
MDISQITGSTQSNSAVQGVQGHQHHRKSIADMIKDMESAIDNAAKAGKLTSDQATAMTKELDDIKQMLSQAQSGGSAQTGGAMQLSADDRQKIRKELHDIGKQLFQALNPQESTQQTQQSSAIDSIFKAMDANQDGNISKDELTSFLSSLTSNASNASGLVSSNFTYSEQATLTINQTQNAFSVTA